MTLISISGIDGSGKTSIAHKLVAVLNTEGYQALYSRPKFRSCKQTEHYFDQIYGDSLSLYISPRAEFYFNILISDWLCHYADFIKDHKEMILVLDRYIVDIFAQGGRY